MKLFVVFHPRMRHDHLPSHGDATSSLDCSLGFVFSKSLYSHTIVFIGQNSQNPGFPGLFILFWIIWLIPFAPSVILVPFSCHFFGILTQFWPTSGKVLAFSDLLWSRELSVRSYGMCAPKTYGYLWNQWDDIGWVGSNLDDVRWFQDVPSCFWCFWYVTVY